MKHLIYWMLIVLGAAISNNSHATGTITMVSNSKNLSFELFAPVGETITIDWGDGCITETVVNKQKEILHKLYGYTKQKYGYSNLQSHTIIIRGDIHV